MHRTQLTELLNWLNSPERKPLVMRGARQVGKTWLARQLAKSANLELIELNFEKQKSFFDHFTTNEPNKIMRNISASLGVSFDAKKCLLFLDEIQVVPEILAKLRWFAEDLPELAVIATGSLLDFSLDNFSYSMPVGRISYLYLEPLSFEDFLLAMGFNQLVDYVKAYQLDEPIPGVIHDQYMTLFKDYLLVGGMPKAVHSWKTYESLSAVNKIHNEIISTYRDDFNKYRGKISIDRLDDAMLSIPIQLGNKFIYKRANPDVHSLQIKSALTLLNKARVTHKVISCHANGIPLAAETNHKFFKEIFLDVGLISAQLGLSLEKVQSTSEINLINKGSIAEQVVGQILRANFPNYIDPALYCWIRETSGSSSEVDYIFQHKGDVIPLEVKAGTTGTLKSLHYFMGQKKFKTAVRVNSDHPSVVNIELKDTLGQEVSYCLVSIPFYLLGQIHRLLDSLSL